MLAFVAISLAACGAGEQGSRGATVDDLSAWLKATGECEDVETSTTQLPVPSSRTEEVAPAVKRFDKQAAVGGLISCGGLNGYISYFRFPSTEARAAAVQERDGLISNELFCAKGPELVVNDLLGYDNTADFCKRLGFPIHQPTHVASAAAERRHRMEATASRLYAHAEGFPLPNVYCESRRGPLEFECGNFVGGEAAYITLVERRGRFVIEGCEAERRRGICPAG